MSNIALAFLQLKLCLLFVVVVCNLLSCHSLLVLQTPTHTRGQIGHLWYHNTVKPHKISRGSKKKKDLITQHCNRFKYFFRNDLDILTREHFKSQDRLLGLPICHKNIREIFKKYLKDTFLESREKYPNQSVSNLIPPIPVPLLLVWAPFPTFPSANKQFLALFGHKCFSQKCFQDIHTFENLKNVFKILTLLTTIDTQIFGFKIVNRKAFTKICSLASHLFF